MKKPSATTTKKIRRKAKRLVREEETQVWLLASPAEADQLANGRVPLDVERQARQALRLIIEEAR